MPVALLRALRALRARELPVRQVAAALEGLEALAPAPALMQPALEVPWQSVQSR